MNWQDYFYYDESSLSCLRWKVDRYAGNQYQVLKVSAGDVAGSLSKRDGYWRVWLLGKSYLVHRVVAALHWSSVPRTVDHKNGVRADNKVANLRPGVGAINARNTRMRISNTSGKTGVKLIVTHHGRYRNWVAFTNKAGVDAGREFESFSCNKYGDETAYRLACEARDKMIEQLNSQNAGYSERHGKEEDASRLQ